jgi:hypothetical protein
VLDPFDSGSRSASQENQSWELVPNACSAIRAVRLSLVVEYCWTAREDGDTVTA